MILHGLTIAFGLVILILSLLPGGTGGFIFLGIPHLDKAGHFAMYAVWSGLFALSMKKPTALRPPFGWPVIIGSTAGILLEFGQLWMHQGRSFETADMIANALGTTCGAWSARWLTPFLRDIPSGKPGG